jgi:hypothetical protein
MLALALVPRVLERGAGQAVPDAAQLAQAGEHRSAAERAADLLADAPRGAAGVCGTQEELQR